MNVPTILILVGLAIVIIALVARRGGPRVTQITRTVRRDEDEDRNA